MTSEGLRDYGRGNMTQIRTAEAGIILTGGSELSEPPPTHCVPLE